MSADYGSAPSPRHNLDGMVIEPANDGSSPAQISNAPFSCNICKRSYTRVDHLARHYRSHTKERPFQCGQCGNRFSRADLLRRHIAAHDRKTDGKRPSQRISLAINRVTSACISCSATKVKCSEKKPCTRCVASKITCEMPKTNKAYTRYMSPSPTSIIVDADVESPASAAIARSLSQQISGDGQDSAQGFLPDADHESLVTHQSFNPNRSSAHSSGEQQSEPGLDAGSASTQSESFSRPKESLELDMTQPGLDFDAALAGSDAWAQPDSSLADFLSQIMVPLPSPFFTVRSNSDGAVEEHDLFDFGIDDGGGFGDFDFGDVFEAGTAPVAPDHMPQQMMSMDASEPPSRADDGVIPLSHSHTTEAFMRSVWQWTPGKLDRSGNENSNLSLPSNVGIPVSHAERVCPDRLSQSSRDRILAMIAGICDSSAFLNIAVQFPAADVLDSFIQDFLFVHRKRAMAFFHVPTFHPNEATPELTAMLAACGAVLNSAPMVRKLGYALQETIRLANPKTWEKDNSRTRDLAMLQAFHMCIQVGVFSGNKRKMEISESQQQPLVTMMRRSGRFYRQRSATVVPLPEDSPEELEIKWRAWAEAESWKRLVFALFVHDGHVSMSLFVPPIMSNTELALGLPASNILWNSGTATEWRDAYHRQNSGMTVRIPSIRTCITDIQVMLDAASIIDVPFARHIMLSVFWRQIWESRQLTFLGQAFEGSDPSTTLCLATRQWRQDCSRCIRQFRMAISDIEPLSGPAALAHEHLLLNIFVSFDELSRFSGKEGTSEALKALPVLRKWAKGRDSRQAVWHAGQLICKAASFPPGLLRDFYAIALYHAGLTIWAYGLLTNVMTHVMAASDLRRESRGLDSLALAAEKQPVVLLDMSDESNEPVQKFINLGRGLPAIGRVGSHTMTSSDPPSLSHGEYVLLRDPMAAMETVINILKRNHTTFEQRSMPLLVENLIHLMSDLSKAAMKMKRP